MMYRTVHYMGDRLLTRRFRNTVHITISELTLHSIQFSVLQVAISELSVLLRSDYTTNIRTPAWYKPIEI